MNQVFKKICPICKGNGYIKKENEVVDYVFAIPTLGLSLLQPRQECNMCEGYGFYYEEVT